MKKEKNKEVALWMVNQTFKNKALDHDTAIFKIEKIFGKGFIYININGNQAIEKEVLKEFKKEHKGKIGWSRGDKVWFLKEEV